MAFQVLDMMFQDAHFRGLFLPSMPETLALLDIFDKMLALELPQLHSHLV